MPKETSETVSSLASSYLRFSGSDLLENIGNAIRNDASDDIDASSGLIEYCHVLAAHIQTLAASCLSQDETPTEE